MADGTAPDFTPFAIAPQAVLPESWLRWLATMLGGQSTPLPAAPSADWSDVLPALHAHGVLPLLYARLRNSAHWQIFDPTTQAALANAYRFNAVRCALLDEELARISAALAGDGISMMLLKGLAAARLVYDSPVERPVSDMDLLVPAAQLGRALRVLSGLGYQQQGLMALSRWQRRYRSETALVGKGRLLVEVHWSLLESPYHIDRLDMNGVWRRGQPADHPPNALLPDLATLLVHTAGHLALHHSRELRLIWLIDVDRLARAAQLDWGRVMDLAERWRLGLAVQASLAATHRWLGTPAPEAVAPRLEELAADPVGVALWGVGNERPGRAWQRARITWPLLRPEQRLRYLAWLGIRALLQPVEAIARRRSSAQQPPTNQAAGMKTWAIL